MRDKIKGAWRSLTIWFNGIMASVVVLLPVAQDQFPQMQSYIPANIYHYGMGALVVGNIMLRFRTSMSLSDKILPKS